MTDLMVTVMDIGGKVLMLVPILWFIKTPEFQKLINKKQKEIKTNNSIKEDHKSPSKTKKGIKKEIITTREVIYHE